MSSYNSVAAGPGYFTYTTNEPDGSKVVMEGELTGFEIECQEFNNYYSDVVLAGSLDITYVARFKSNSLGPAFKVTKKFASKVEHMRKIETPDFTKESYDKAFDQIKAPKDAQIVCGELDGKNWMVATWVT